MSTILPRQQFAIGGVRLRADRGTYGQFTSVAVPISSARLAGGLRVLWAIAPRACDVRHSRSFHAEPQLTETLARSDS